VSVSLAVVGDKDLKERMNAYGRAVQKSVNGAKYAANLHLAKRISEDSPVDTGAMQESIGVTSQHVEQVAPYTVYVDGIVGHVTLTYEMEAKRALDIAAKTGNWLLRTNQGVRAVPNPLKFPKRGVYRPRNESGVGIFT
jgi:hypothetical protein